MTEDKRSGPAPRSRLLVRAEIELTFDDPQRCHEAQAALSPESKGFLQIDAEGEKLHLSVPEGHPNRVLSTLDDTIACLQAAEASRDASRNASRDASRAHQKE